MKPAAAIDASLVAETSEAFPCMVLDAFLAEVDSTTHRPGHPLVQDIHSAVAKVIMAALAAARGLQSTRFAVCPMGANSALAPAFGAKCVIRHDGT
jgi:hypothetical protein